MKWRFTGKSGKLTLLRALRQAIRTGRGVPPELKRLIDIE
jgi:hypothetical protein